MRFFIFVTEKYLSEGRNPPLNSPVAIELKGEPYRVGSVIEAYIEGSVAVKADPDLDPLIAIQAGFSKAGYRSIDAHLYEKVLLPPLPEEEQ